MKLSQYLSQQGISAAEFAALIGVDRATVYRLKKDEQLPSKAVADAIFAATDAKVTANDFYEHYS